MQYDMHLRMGRQQQGDEFPVSRVIRRGNNSYTSQPILLLTLSTAESYMRYSTLYYKAGSVLGNFVQLQAHVKCSQNI